MAYRGLPSGGGVLLEAGDELDQAHAGPGDREGDHRERSRLVGAVGAEDLEVGAEGRAVEERGHGELADDDGEGEEGAGEDGDEDVAPVAAKLMDSHDAFLAPATTTGKNVAPRVAALLDVMQLSDILSVEGADSFTRPIYAGNAIATVRSKDAKKVITVRGTAFDKAARDGGSGSVEAV